jgi:hypothetical protein
MADTDNENKLTIALPGEWAVKQAFGPALGELGEDIKKLYSVGRDNIIIAGYNKIKNKADGKSANLRVTRDVFWNGSFTDETICAEYFGGILASSRSDDGKDDTGIYYVDLIKSLSSNQLKLHYLIYLSFNKCFASDSSKSQLNPGQESELSSEEIFLYTNELLQITGEKDIGRDLHAIHAKGLIGDFQTQNHKLKDGRHVSYLKVSPKSLGIQLYAVAHNRLREWRKFAIIDFGDFDSLSSPKFREKNIEDLLTSAGIEDKEPEIKNEEN